MGSKHCQDTFIPSNFALRVKQSSIGLLQATGRNLAAANNPLLSSDSVNPCSLTLEQSARCVHITRHVDFERDATAHCLSRHPAQIHYSILIGARAT